MTSDREKRFAYIIKAFDSMLTEKSAYLSEWNARWKKLDIELKDISNEIITGQAPLALEPVEEEVKL